MSEDQSLYVFVHLSKTGGTTLYKHLRRYLSSEKELVYLGPEGDLERKRLGRPPLEDRPEKDRKRVRVLIGHKVTIRTLDLVPWREPRLIFFIRHPVRRMISKYNYQMYLAGKQDYPVPFDQWRAELKPNAWDTAFWLCRRFLELPPKEIREVSARQEIARQLLHQFYYVSTTERLDKDAAPLLSEMGIPTEMRRENVGGRDHRVILKATPEIDSTIAKEFASEMDFYRYWSSLSPYRGAPGRPSI